MYRAPARVHASACPLWRPLFAGMRGMLSKSFLVYINHAGNYAGKKMRQSKADTEKRKLTSEKMDDVVPIGRSQTSILVQRYLF
jgi:hypothetical protein